MEIKRLREAAGLRQYELAARMGVKQASVSAWESGLAYPSAANLLKLADIFSCTTDEILGRKSASA
jgi:transcriptional regulator with XRE-family HTH domain